MRRKDAAALGGGRLAPFAGERGLRRRDGRIDVGRAAARDAGRIRCRRKGFRAADVAAERATQRPPMKHLEGSKQRSGSANIHGVCVRS